MFVVGLLIGAFTGFFVGVVSMAFFVVGNTRGRR